MDDVPSDSLPASSPPSSASDDEAFNTAGARIHFGPLRSPEKKFVPMVARRSTIHLQPGLAESPLRRSPRLSTPRPASPSPAPVQGRIQGYSIDIPEGDEDEKPEDVPLSRAETPENDSVAQEEPSSVLAFKITRAHDNPSPPPSTTGTLALLDIESPLSLSPRPVSPLITVTDANSSDEIDDSTRFNPNNLNQEQQDLSAPSTPPPRSIALQHDLISFESFSTPAAVFRKMSPQASTSLLLPSSDNPSVDQLYSRSPSPSRALNSGPISDQSVPLVIVESSEGDSSKGKEKVRPEMTPEYADEQSVAHALVFESFPGLSSIPESPPGMSLTEEMLITPVKRSAGSDSGTTLSGQDRIQASSKRRRESATPGATHRQLGSLSPKSTGLLSQLLSVPLGQSPPPAPNDLGLSVDVPDNVQPNDPVQPMFNLFPQASLPPQTPKRSTSPIRFSSPSRSNASQSPNKVRLQVAALDDPNRTPARRIPVEEAVAQGHIFPMNVARLTANRTEALRTPSLNITSTDSPARRVELSKIATPSNQKQWQGMRFGSPTRGVSKERSVPPESRIAGPSGNNLKEKSDSKPLSSAKDSTSLRPPVAGPSTSPRKARLPFPIVASKTNRTMTEEGEKTSEVRTGSPAKLSMSSPVKSSLKQSTSSRIPRVKPYTRPLPKPVEKTKPGTAMRSVDISKETRKFTPVVSGADSTGIASSSDDTAPTQPKTATIPTSTFTAITSTLKRKRAPEKIPSVPKPRPVVLLRQVPRVAASNTASTSQHIVLPSVNAPAKKPLQQIRRVVDRLPEPQLIQPLPESDAEIVDDQETAHDGNDKATTKPLDPPAERPSTPPSLPNRQDTSPGEFDSSGDGGRRRTTRVRKPVNSAYVDVFGSSDAPPMPPRRRTGAQTSVRPTETFFGGMSAVALKALTSSNTVKNQRYLAAKLETEVIRREGARPESPAVKIKTILQRQEDEKIKQRKERADRRARRSNDGSSGAISDDEQSNASDSSVRDMDSDVEDENSSPVQRRRHTRGPGDEDDYETPVKPRRIKRLKLGDDGDNQSSENERRVKWDRGLFTMIYLDEVKVGTRRPPKENVATKGCLALTAKAVALDNLGNLPYADSPLTELIEENVVVKKFVYDNDEEPIAPTIVVKNTRLRSKKAKN